MKKVFQVEPFKLLGDPESWGNFGTDAADLRCDAERRALLDHFTRRKDRLVRRQQLTETDAWAIVLSGAAVSIANLYMAMAGGTAGLGDDDFDKFISLCTFAWFQSFGADEGEAGRA